MTEVETVFDTKAARRTGADVLPANDTEHERTSRQSAAISTKPIYWLLGSHPALIFDRVPGIESSGGGPTRGR